MRAAIDGDIVLYAVCFAANDDPVAYACRSAKSFCRDVMHSLTVEGADIFLTGAGNYRKEYGFEHFPYKGNRSEDKPHHYEDLRRYMIEDLGAVVVDGQEADDTLGILGYAGSHVICTIDKDLDGVPGWHWNWKRKSLYSVSPEDADRFFYTQMLTGDSTDNIPGLFRMVGKKVMPAVKAPLADMTDPADMYAYVRSVYLDGYEKVGMCMDEADEVVDNWLLKIGRMLWIRRVEGELWTPPEVV
jgi:hypothetical protein